MATAAKQAPRTTTTMPGQAVTQNGSKSAQTPAPSDNRAAGHLMTTSERAQYDATLKSQGKDAAEAYKKQTVGVTSAEQRAGAKAQPQAPGANFDPSSPTSAAGAQHSEDVYAQTRDQFGQNANFTGPLGTSTTTIDPVTGQANVVQKNSTGNQGALDSGQSTYSMGNSMAQKLLGGVPGQYDVNGQTAAYGIPQDNPQQTQDYQDAAYKSLTRGLDTQQKTADADQEQRLAERGIPIGSDAYNKAFKQVDDPFTQQKEDAQSQAYASGLGAQTSHFNMGLQGHNTAVNDYNGQFTLPSSVAAQMAGTGQGYVNPNLPGYTGSTYAPVNYAGIYGTNVGNQTQQQQNQILGQYYQGKNKNEADMIAAGTGAGTQPGVVQ